MFLTADFNLLFKKYNFVVQEVLPSVPTLKSFVLLILLCDVVFDFPNQISHIFKQVKYCMFFFYTLCFNEALNMLKTPRPIYIISCNFKYVD